MGTDRVGEAGAVDAGGVMAPADVLGVIADRIPAMLAYWDASQHCRYANRAYEGWFGVDPNTMPGRSMSTFLGPLYALNRPYIERALRGEEQEFERDIPDPAGGSPRRSQALYVPHIVDGEVRGFCVLVVDVTRRKRAEEALQSAQRRLSKAERRTALATLSAGIGHELNNPLATVLGNLEIAASLTDGAGDPTALRSALSDALGAARHMKEIVKGMQQLARGDASAHTTIDLNEIVERSIELSSHAVRYRARVERDLEADIAVDGHAGQLVQVFVNLLVNAAHALNAGRLRANVVSVRTRREGHRAVVEVEDNGCGIPDETLPHIFEPFFTTKSLEEGTGLGLSISRNIVEAHGGSIGATSTIGRGTVLRVELPLSSTPGASAARPPPPGDLRATEAFAPTAGARPHVVIIDDNAVLAKSLRALLHECDVTVFEGGRAATSYLLGAHPRIDLVVCDLTMPEMTGADVYEALVESRSELAARFVIMTGGAFTEAGRAFLGRAAVPVLEKPFAAADVRRLLRSRKST